MVKAVWKGNVIAESDDVEIIEGNYYFPPDAVKNDLLVDSETTSICPWKGEANYYDIVIDKQINKNAAWYYPNPKPKASKIKDYVAFWKGVKIEE